MADSNETVLKMSQLRTAAARGRRVREAHVNTERAASGARRTLELHQLLQPSDRTDDRKTKYDVEGHELTCCNARDS